jgi:small subunit ribosomal protein S8
MTMTDPIADMLARLRNANMAYKEEIVLPASNLKLRIAEILTREGYLAGSSMEGEGKDRAIRIQLKYGPSRERTLSGLKRVSRPGRRVYVDRQDVPRVLGGLGIAILSTSQGLLTDRQAKKRGVGGEVLAYIW